MQNIPFKLVSDSEINIGSAKGFATKRCGVEFKDLDQAQNARLNCLVETLLALPWGFSFADRNIGFQRSHAGACSNFFISLTPSRPPDTQAQTYTT
jgi:hypothetical protein